MAAVDFKEYGRRMDKALAKGATSRKIAIAVRRTYAKSSIVNALRQSQSCEK